MCSSSLSGCRLCSCKHNLYFAVRCPFLCHLAKSYKLTNILEATHIQRDTHLSHIVALLPVGTISTMAQTGVSGLVVVDGESFLDALFASAGQGRGTRQHRLQVDGRRRRHRSWPGRCEMRRLRCTTRQQRRWQQRQMHRAMHDLCPLWRPRCSTWWLR